jgi:hypothetical protein
VELNRSEGWYLVAYFFEETNKCLSDQLEYLSYDDSCHLAELDHSLINKTFVIDRFHLKNQKQKTCHTFHN